MTARTRKPTPTPRQARLQRILDAEGRLWPQLDEALKFASYPERYAAELTKAMEIAIALVLELFPLATGRPAHPERVTRLKGTPKPAVGAPSKCTERMAVLHTMDDAFMDLFDEIETDMSQEELNGLLGEALSLAFDYIAMTRPLYADVKATDDPLLNPKTGAR
jgi:hypothetical protein